MSARSAIASADIRTGADRTLELLEAQVGRSLDEVETPVAVVDLDRLEANLGRLQSYADEHAISLWPHTKTHKSPEIGMRQLAIGAGGLTVAKIVEAVGEVDAMLRETRDAFLAAGIGCDRISGGSTPTRYLTHTTCVNELRAGTYALLDRNDALGEPDLGFDACALTVAVTVVSD